MTQPTSYISVLTGDLVNSTALGTDNIARAFDSLEDCARQQSVWTGAPLRFSRHRGDGWQVALMHPRFTLRSAIAFQASLKALGPAFDTYIGIASGPLPPDIPDDLNDATAEVFAHSGRALDHVKAADTPLRMHHASRGAIAATFVLADQITQHWTQTQAATMLAMIMDTETPTYSHVAQLLGKSRQTVTKTLDAAGHAAFVAAFDMLERPADD